MKTLLAAWVVAAVAAPVSRAPGWMSLLKAAPSPSSSCARVPPAVAGGTQGYADSLSGGKCYVSIHPMSTEGLVYRDYTFFSDGMLLVFNSFGDGEDVARLTAAREFYFFPRRGRPELALDPAAPSVSVRMADGGRVGFDPATAQIASVERGAATVSPRVDPADRGGVEFTSYNGLMLDAGFRRGELPSGRPESESVFRSAYGQRCAVKNKEVFAYAGGEPSFKFSDVELSAWLRTRCPGLSVGF